jgi:hypothetical protein
MEKLTYPCSKWNFLLIFFAEVNAPSIKQPFTKPFNLNPFKSFHIRNFSFPPGAKRLREEPLAPGGFVNTS